MLFGKETEVHHSCSVTYRNRFYVFGGDQHKRQISEVTKCELTRIGNLDFDHHWGSCSSVNDQEIYLCFDWSNTYQCRSADDPLGRFTEIAPSIYPHRLSRTAASKSSFFLLFSFLSPFVGELLAVGSSKWNHVKTEMYLTEVGRWYKLDDFPFDWESKMIFFFFLFENFSDSQGSQEILVSLRSIVSRWFVLSVWRPNSFVFLFEYNCTTGHENYYLVESRVLTRTVESFKLQNNSQCPTCLKLEL